MKELNGIDLNHKLVDFLTHLMVKPDFFAWKKELEVDGAVCQHVIWLMWLLHL